MELSSAVGKNRRNPAFIDGLLSQPTFLYSFQTCLKQLEAVYPSRLRFRSNALQIRIHVSSWNRLRLVAGGRLCVMVAHRLLCVPGQRIIDCPIRHGAAILSRRHRFKKAPATCVATLKGHSDNVTSVAFHSSATLLATGNSNGTAKLWRISPDGTAATCVATLEGHSDSVNSVDFHPTLPLLATGSCDKTAKVWRMSPDSTAATCVATLKGHSGKVLSVSFHASAPLLATGSCDKTAKLWCLKLDGTAPTCVKTLAGYDKWVSAVAFHPILPLLAIKGGDGTVKIVK
jgi:WD40 repeat protein